ncbi:MAG: AAA family ATPase, partial [Gammaproteobacteria bacterium]|nr:AAA family ATPase [Gammaproteobacteria bacterium]
MTTSTRVEIDGFRGCISLAFDIKKQGVTFLSGPNTSGKSSAIYGIGAALSRDQNPMGFSAAQYKRYKHRENE